MRSLQEVVGAVLRNTLFTLYSLVLLFAATQTRACGTGSSNSKISGLPTLGGSSFAAYGLNATGQVTGVSYITGDLGAHAFLYANGALADLGTLGGNVSQGFAINAAGQIAGESDLGGTGDPTHAFFYDGTNMIDLGTLGGSFSSASAVNDAGQVAGHSLLAGDSVEDAFLYANGSMTNLGDLGGGFSSATAINQSGSIVGDSFTMDFDQHAFLYSGGVLLDLGTLGGNYSSPFAINDTGFVAGESSSTNGEVHAFAYANGVMADLGTLGGSYSSAIAVNKSGQIIGVANTVNDAESHGFIYSGGTMTDLGTLGGDYSNPSAINNPGQVVGDAGLANGDSHAFLWQNGQMVDLNTLLPTNSGWELFSAVFINESSTIVGAGQHNGTNQWYIMNLATANNPPVAVAGPDQSVECQTQVTLDGSQSSDPDGDALNFEWSAGGLVMGTNAVLTASFPLGTNVITLKVTDPCGAASQTNVVVYVTDTVAPVIVSGPLLTPVSADNNCQGAVPEVASRITATDNCTPANALVITQSPATGTLVGIGSHLIIVTVTDASGNSTQGSTSFSVADTTPPTIVSVPAAITVSADANCQGAVPNALPNVVATDNCTPVNQLGMSQNPAAGTLLGVGQYTISVTVSDASANSASASVSLKIVDTTAPTIVSTPSAMTVSADANCQAVVPNVLAGVSATDNCTPANQLVMSQNPVAGTLLGVGQYTISVTVSDASANSASASVSLKIVDTTAPTIVSTPSAMTVSADANCQAVVPNVLAGVSATDNCTPANQLVMSQNPAAGTVVGKGQYSIVVSVSDAAGNAATASVGLKVVDVTAPTILSTPPAITVSPDETGQARVPNVTGNVVAADNCTPANQLQFAQTPIAGTSLPVGQYTIIVTVSDAAGNSANTSVSFKVADTTPPTIVSTPAPTTVSADVHCQGVVPNVLAGVVATDNCTPASQLVMTQNPAAGTVVGHGQYTIVVTVTDAAGNSSTANVAFTVADTTAPVIQSVVASPNVLSPPNHQLVPITVSVTATDNCDTAPVSRIISITANEAVAAGDIQITGNLTATLAASRNPSGTGRTYTITVQCTDASGNSSTATVTVSVPKGSGKP